MGAHVLDLSGGFPPGSGWAAVGLATVSTRSIAPPRAVGVGAG